MKFNFSAAVSQYSVLFGIICVSAERKVYIYSLRAFSKVLLYYIAKKDFITPNGNDKAIILSFRNLL